MYPGTVARPNLYLRTDKGAQLAVKFLTEEWMSAVQGALNGDEAFKEAISNVDLSLQFKVTEVPGEDDVDYSLSFENGQAAVSGGELDGADATITNDYETAIGISKGDLNTQMAFMTGKLKVAGNMGKVMMNQGAINKITDALAGLDIEY
jgi:putative sterol carrier protein